VCNETEKAMARRVKEGYFDKFLVGSGIDIGCGPDILCSPYTHVVVPKLAFANKEPSLEDSPVYEQKVFSVRGWDQKDGDAQYMNGVEDESYDFVYSSHCLEHMVDPSVALRNWWRILKRGGHLVVIVPDEDLYEQGVWPSRGNGDHKTTWTRYKGPGESWSPVSRSLLQECQQLPNARIISCRQMDINYDYELAAKGYFDQTGPVVNGTEAAVEAVVYKPKQLR
jgi:SAM-dependent methyltransferase